MYYSAITDKLKVSNIETSGNMDISGTLTVENLQVNNEILPEVRTSDTLIEINSDKLAVTGDVGVRNYIDATNYRDLVYNVPTNRYYGEGFTPAGFYNRTNATFSSADLGTTFRVDVNFTGDVTVFKKNEHTFTNGDSLTITVNPSRSGIFMFTITDDFTALEEISTYPDIFSTDICFVCAVYWNDTLDNLTGGIFDERHGITMDRSTHSYLHVTQGYKYVSGGQINGNELLGAAPSSDNDCRVYFDSTINMYDEDLFNQIVNDGTPTNPYEQDLGTGIASTNAAKIPTYYRSGSSGDWTAYLGALNIRFPFKYSTSIQYNQLSGPNWLSTDCVNNSYVCYYICATNDISTPVISLMSQYNPTSLTDAQEESIVDLSYQDPPYFFTPEIKPLWKIIYRVRDAYVTTANCAIYSFTDLRPSGVSIISGSAVTNHAGLSGLSYDNSGHTDFQRQTHFYASAPTANDDEVNTSGTMNGGAKLGDIWWDSSTHTGYIATDVTTAASVWKSIPSPGDGSNTSQIIQTYDVNGTGLYTEFIKDLYGVLALEALVHTTDSENFAFGIRNVGVSPSGRSDFVSIVQTEGKEAAFHMIFDETIGTSAGNRRVGLHYLPGTSTTDTFFTNYSLDLTTKVNRFKSITFDNRITESANIISEYYRGNGKLIYLNSDDTIDEAGDFISGDFTIMSKNTAIDSTLTVQNTDVGSTDYPNPTVQLKNRTQSGSAIGYIKLEGTVTQPSLAFGTDTDTDILFLNNSNAYFERPIVAPGDLVLLADVNNNEIASVQIGAGLVASPSLLAEFSELSGGTWLYNVNSDSQTSLEIDTATGKVTYSSSTREDKQDIVDFDVPTKEFFDRLRLRRYSRKISPGKIEVGFIAEEIEEALDDIGLPKSWLITHDKQGKITGYRDSQIKFLLFDRVMEQQQEIEELRTNLETLREENISMKQKMAQIETNHLLILERLEKYNLVETEK
jgi:hypothetical protein